MHLWRHDLRILLLLGATLALTAGASTKTFAHQAPVRVVKPDGPTGPDYGCFGQAVLISGQFAFVGDPCENSPSQSGVGAVYRLHRYGAGWIADQRLASAYPADNGRFGASMTIYNDILIVGAPGEQSSGLVYQFANAFDTPIEAPMMFVPYFSAPNAAFGTSMAAYSALGPQILVGAPFGMCPSNIPGGFAMVSLFALPSYVCTPASSEKAAFGASMIGRGDMVLIGAPGVDAANPATAGSGYLYRMGFPIDPSTLLSVFVPSDPNVGRRFGISLDMNDAAVVFGAPMGTGGQPGNGEVWIYAGKVPNWGLQAVLEEPGTSPTRTFGTSVALSNTTLWVGSPGTAGGGALYEYTNSTTGWNLTDTVGAYAADSFGNLGASIAVNGVTWIAGLPTASSSENSFSTGAVYISTDDYIFEGGFDHDPHSTLP